jgi:TetR/AcrR family transcriptional regulator, regulator of mycofactocin system
MLPVSSQHETVVTLHCDAEYVHRVHKGRGRSDPVGDNATSAATRSRAGRKRATSRSELEHAAFELFAAQGFADTTVDDIARSVGIGRRTFFNYFDSKNDVVWGDFDAQLYRMRQRLDASPCGVPLMDTLRRALVEFNRVDAAELPWHRRRMELILRVPALQAHSTLRYGAWRRVIADFVGGRLKQPPDSLAPQAMAHAMLGVAIAAYEQWLSREDADLLELLDAAMRELAAGFACRT